jgi:hypothetical protein
MSVRVVALGQRGRRVAAPSATTMGPDHGARGRRGWQDKQAGGDTGRADPQRLAMSTGLAHAPNASDRPLGIRPGGHHPGGRQRAVRTGLAPLDTLLPSQRRALPAGQGGVEGEGGRCPTPDGRLNLPILSSRGSQCGAHMPYHSIRGNVGSLAYCSRLCVMRGDFYSSVCAPVLHSRQQTSSCANNSRCIRSVTLLDGLGVLWLCVMLHLAWPSRAPVSSRRSVEPETPVRWRPCTPAMAAGLTDHVWTLHAVRMFRVPPWPQPCAG